MWKKIVFIVANVFYTLIAWYFIKYCVDWFVNGFLYNIWTIIGGIVYFVIIAAIAVSGILFNTLIPIMFLEKDFVKQSKSQIIYLGNLLQIAIAVMIMYDKLNNQTAVVYTVLLLSINCACYSLFINSISKE